MKFSLLKLTYALCLVFGLALVMSICASAHPFEDVPEWADVYVDEVYEKGIMNGTADTVFASDMSLTREQLVVTLYRMSGATVEYSDYFLREKFADSETISSWARDAVQWAFAEGITAGISENDTIVFKPQKEVTRQEVAKFLVTFMESFDYDVKYGNKAVIKDLNTVASWALAYVEKCISAGIINGDSYGNFSPTGYATRVAAAKMIACLPEERLQVNRDYDYVAHRGLCSNAKENTIAAFIAAGEGDYYGIESDVWMTKDGKFVMHHDQDIIIGEKVYDIIECTWDEIKDLVLPDPYGLYDEKDLKIPLLSDYVNICKTYGKEAVLEIKQPRLTKEQMTQLVAEIKELDYFDNVTFISFNIINCHVLREVAPDAKIMKLHEGVIEEANVESLIKNNFGLAIRYDYLTKADVELMHANGLKVNAWTCDSEYWAERLASWGVDTITTDALQ